MLPREIPGRFSQIRIQKNDPLHAARSQDATQGAGSIWASVETEEIQFEAELRCPCSGRVDHNLLHGPRLRLLRRRNMHEGQTAQESLGAGSSHVGHHRSDEMIARIAEPAGLRLNFFAHLQADVRVT